MSSKAGDDHTTKKLVKVEEENQLLREKIKKQKRKWRSEKPRARDRRQG